MILIGTLLALNSLAIAAWWLATGQPNRIYMMSVLGLAVFVGIFLVVQDRVLEITIKGVGTIKAAAEQAILDAKQIAELRQRIEAQSATVDLVARQATEAKKLSEELHKKSQIAEQKLESVDQILAKSTAILSELQLITNFTATVVLAQNDDREAFDQLRRWSEEKSNPLSARALQAWATILDQHNPAIVMGGFTIPWREGLDPSKLTLEDLRKLYEESPPFMKPALLEYIWNRQDIPKKERMAFLAGVLQKEQSLKALQYAGRYFAQGADLKLKPLAVDEMLAWWKQNQSKVQ